MTHYEILGISLHASPHEIKTAYRKMVKKYHPDKNPSTEARAIIRQVNEAYDVLSDPARKASYDRGFQYHYTPEQAYTEDPREVYRREYIRKKREEARIREERRMNLKKTWFKIARMISFPIFAFALLVIADYYLPSSTYDEHGEMGWQVSRGRRNSKWLVSYMKTEHFEFAVPHQLHLHYDYYGEKPVLHIAMTPIFRTIKTITVDMDGVLRSYPGERTVYSRDMPWHFLLLASALFTMWAREHTQRNYALCFLPMLLFVIVLLMM